MIVSLKTRNGIVLHSIISNNKANLQGAKLDTAVLKCAIRTNSPIPKASHNVQYLLVYM